MTTTPDVDFTQVRSLVDRAVHAATPAAQMYERKIRPESEFGIREPRPRAGLQAALAVARIATGEAYKFAKGLRAEGVSWRDLADLLEIPWSEDYHKPERAYELVADPRPGHRRGAFADLNVYWTCGGPNGCGQYITDRGPYNGSPDDNETGHAEGCARLASEIEAWRFEVEERDRRARIMDENLPKVTDSFGQETVGRVRYVENHGGRWLPWSTSESLAVALVLRDQEQLAALGYSTQKEALARITSGMGRPPANPAAWLRLVRLASLGIR